MSWFSRVLDRLFGAVSGPSPPRPIPRPGPGLPSPTPSGGDLAAELLALHNRARAAAGLTPLALEPHLTTAAQAFAGELARRDVLTHVGQDGSWPWDRIGRTGYAWKHDGENAAEGQPDAPTVVADWMQSPGHRANILDPGYRQVGFGHALAANGDAFWVADFGGPA